MMRDKTNTILFFSLKFRAARKILIITTMGMNNENIVSRNSITLIGMSKRILPIMMAITNGVTYVLGSAYFSSIKCMWCVLMKDCYRDG